MRAEVFRVGDGDHIVPGVRRRPPPPLDRVRCPRRISAWGTACGLDEGQSSVISSIFDEEMVSPFSLLSPRLLRIMITTFRTESRATLQ